LPIKDKGIYIQTDWWEGFMEYVVEVGSGATMYIHRHTDMFIP
jgi:hypothetical protein